MPVVQKPCKLFCRVMCFRSLGFVSVTDCFGKSYSLSNFGVRDIKKSHGFQYAHMSHEEISSADSGLSARVEFWVKNISRKVVFFQHQRDFPPLHHCRKLCSPCKSLRAAVD